MSDSMQGRTADTLRKIEDLLLRGLDQEALELAESALGDAESRPRILCAMAALHYRAGALGYAIQLLASLLDQPGCPVDVPEVLAVLYSQAGCVSDALYYAKLSTTQGADRSVQRLFGSDFPPFNEAFAQARPKPLLGNGMMALEAGNLDRARFLVEQHLTLLPDDVEALDIYAKIMIRSGKINEAIGLLRTVSTLAGPSATLLSRLANCLIWSGQFIEGLACHHEAIARAPDSLTILGSAVNDLGYFGKAEAEASGIIQIWQDELTKASPKKVRPAPKYTGATPIRLCYLCTALDSDELKSMVGSIAQAHDRSRFSVVAFGWGEMDHPSNQWARGAFDQWRDISSLDVTTLGAVIRGEGIHILIDADGRLAPEMRTLFVRNSAPLQLAWLNPEIASKVPGAYLMAVPGTGEAAADELALPAGRYFMGNSAGSPPIKTPAPVESARNITFGAELIRPELNPRLAMVWGRILQSVPNSVLLLRDNGIFAESTNVDALISMFGNAGVAHRIEVIRDIDRAGFAASIDIALMPFPAGNILTYAEFLRNGVPVVTTSSCPAGADMAAFLSAAGLEKSLVNADTAAYAASAIALALDVPALVALRDRLPECVAGVPAFSAKGFAKMFEDAVVAALTQSPT